MGATSFSKSAAPRWGGAEGGGAGVASGGAGAGAWETGGAWPPTQAAKVKLSVKIKDGVFMVEVWFLWLPLERKREGLSR